MSESDLRIGVVGAGIMGSGHVEYLTRDVAGVSVVAIAEPNESLTQSLLNRLEIECASFNSLESMLDGAHLDGVVIASPDRFHAESIRMCFSRNMPTLCEKPLAQTLLDGEELSKLANESLSEVGRPLVHLGFMRRFDPPLVEVRKVIHSKQFGELLYVNASTRNVHSPSIKSEELLTNIAVHELDTMRWLLSDEWSELTVLKGRTTRSAPQGTQDSIVLTGKMEGGVAIVADIFANNTYGYDVRCEFTFENAVLRLGIWGDLSIVQNLKFPESPGFKLGDNWIARFRKAYIHELVEWSETLRGKESKDLATVDDGLKALQVINWVM